MFRSTIVIAILVATSLTFGADNYPTEVWPLNSTIEGLNNTTDSPTGLPYIAVGTNPQSTPSLRVQYDRRLARQNAILAAVNAGRVVQVADNNVGCFPADFRLQGSDYHYPGEVSVAISSTDDTYYVYLDSDSDQGGNADVTVVTDGTGWPADPSIFIPLAQITVASNVISAIDDVRNRVRLAVDQSYDPGLADIAALAVTDSNFIVGDGSNWVAESGATARTSLGVAIGSDVQAYDAGLADIAGLALTDGNIIVGDGSNWVAESGATARTSLGLGSIATQAANNVSISGGSITGITDLAVADGGTAASTATAARSNLGLVIGTDVQAYDAGLADIAGLALTDGNIIVGDGSNWIAESGATARTSLGVAIGSDVQAYDAGLADIAGLAVTDSNIIVADGSNWIAETGATARTSLGVAIGSDVQAYDADLAAVAGLASNGVIARTGAGTAAARTITGGTGITVTNGDGVSGNPSIAVSDGGIAMTQLATAIEDLLPNIQISAAAQAGQTRTITLQARDGADANLAQRCAFQVWIDDADFGAPDATGNAVANLATQLQQIVANAHYTAISNASGATTFDLTVAAGGTRHVMAEMDGRIYSLQVDFTAP